MWVAFDTKDNYKDDLWSTITVTTSSIYCGISMGTHNPLNMQYVIKVFVRVGKNWYIEERMKGKNAK